ncbi:MAG: hypothetical protein ACOYOK_00310 [Pseudobdellovibrionaceae bacterium]
MSERLKQTLKILVFTGFIAAALWRVDQSYMTGRQQIFKSRLQQQVFGTEQILLNQFQLLQKNLFYAVSLQNVMESKKVDWPWEAFPDQYAVVVFNKNQKDTETPVLVSFKERSLASTWSEQDKTDIKNINNTHSSEIWTLNVWFDGSQKKHLHWQLQQGPWSVHLWSDFKSLSHSFFWSSQKKMDWMVFNFSGINVLHSVAEYMGQSMGQTQVFKYLQQSTQLQGDFVLQDSQNSTLNYFKRIPQTNLFVTTQVANSVVQEGRWQLLGPLAVFFIGILLLVQFSDLIFAPKKSAAPKRLYKETVLSTAPSAVILKPEPTIAADTTVKATIIDSANATAENTATDAAKDVAVGVIADSIPQKVLGLKNISTEEMVQVKAALLDEVQKDKKAFPDINFDSLLDELPSADNHVTAFDNLKVEFAKEEIKDLDFIEPEEILGKELKNYKTTIRRPGQGVL